MNKKITIAIFISVVLALAIIFGVFFNNSSKKTTNTALPKIANTNLNNKNETAVKKDESTTEKINCGNVLASHSLPQDKTSAENDALECLGNAILDCQPAIVNFTGEGSYRYTVEKKENNFCFISQEIDKSLKKTTCKFPLQILANNKAYVKENKLENTYFAIIVYSLVSHEIKDVKTSETINLECF